MPNHVWGYWDCPYCGNKGIRGDNKHCPACGNPVPPDIRFYLKEDAKEEVAESEKNDDANWICEYCSAQNDAKADVCINCGAPKSEAERDYFGNAMNGAAPRPAPLPEAPVQTAPPKSSKRGLIIAAAVLFIVGFFIWLLSPVTKSAVIEGFEWERTIEIEEFQKVEESDWSLPAGARLQYSREEISHYVQVIDHYERRTRQVSHQEFDGYDTSYRDLGNGQFEEVQTPRYRTVWEEEEYEEPIYRSQPVYETKYYYDIDRWIKVSEAYTSGQDHDPYWKDTGLDTSVSSPQYGDRREGARSEKYYAVITDKKGNTKKIEYSFSEWSALSVGDNISYKTSRLS